ncbi:chromodomain-helicase-DNA-binding protein 7 isoform 4-T5 [Trichechus inunguis]
MADPGMMSLFGEDGNIFSEGLEGLGECGYPENPVNPMGQQMPIDQGFASLQSSLHHPSTNQNQTKLTHFDHYNQYEQQKMHLMDQPNRMMGSAPGNGLASPHSQYHTPPVPQVPHGGSGGGQMGVYPGLQNERHGQSFVDSGSMWGPRAVQVPDQIRAPYQQQQQPPPQPAPSGPPTQGHPPHMQQMGSYMARGDFSMQQHGQPQQRMSQFSQGQEGLNQGNPFIATSGPGHLSHVPQQSPSMAPSLRHSVQQFHHHAPTALHGESVAHSPRFSPNPPQQGTVRPQTLNFSSRSQTVPSPTINNSGQYSRYPYSNLNQGLVNNTGMNQNLGLTNNTPMNQSVPRYPNAVGFPSNSGQGLMHQQPIHPSGSLNQMNTQTMHPSQPQGTYASPPPMSPMKAMSNPAGTPPPQVRPGSAGMPMEVGSYPNIPHPQPSHQPPGAMGIGQRNMGPRNLQQSRPFIGMSSAPRELTGHMRPNGCPGVGLADPQAIQERLLPGQQHPGQQPPFQQLPTCPPMQPHPGVHHQSSPPPHPHHQPWAQLHPSPQNTPQKVPVRQHSPSEPFLEKPGLDVTQVSGPNAQLGKSEDYLPSIEQQPQQKKKKKKNNHIVAEDSSKSFGKDDFPGGVDNQELSRNSLDGSQDEKKKKKKPKAKQDPKEPKEPKEKKEPKEPKTPKVPKIPKEPKEKKAKTATPKPKSSKKSSNKKPDSEASALKKKVNKGKTEGSENSDLEKTPPPSPPPEEDDDPGVQKRRSSRQVKRKRYTEDLEFKISDEEADDADAAGRDSPSNTSQSEQQESVDAEGPVVEKIMSSRSVKKQKESGEEVEVEEFYVKYKNFSYLHCQWASVEDLEKDKRIQQKIKRFKAKQGQNKFLSEIEDELFNPDYVEVDRIMDFARSTDDRGEPVTHYLVKWCSLPYEDSTWELRQDLDPAKIEEFEKLMSREPETERVERPPADDWKKSESSREYKNNNKLREYQLEGVNWLLFNWYNMRNCILADEMGLGKTIQSITFLYEIYLKGIHGPFLVIAPLSTIPNWEREFRTWTELNVVVYHGSQASRRTIQLYEMYFKDPQGRVMKGSYKFHAIITTFEMILTDCPELRNIPWRCVVIDEAHRLKNRNCKLLEGLKMMDLEHKVLLTGTPLQNTVEELFSLLHFLEPSRFPSETTFMQEFGDLKTEEQVQKLQAILKPMMLRRLKEDVEKNLAPKEETIIEVELTNIQKKYYRAILEKNFTFLSKGGGQANVPNLLNTMMELRKCCNHPYLINGAEEKILEEFKETHNAESPDFQLQAMIQAAGKLVLIDKLLPKLKAGGHRVLIFSQMVRCLDILEDYLIQRRYPYERIDGRVRGNLRQAAIDRFSKPDSDRFVFLLCTRAGGLGINLTAADTCIIFDSDWNPQNDLQAQARCHRIGQSKSVKIYRLITRNSYEREMFDKASLKLGLDKAVLQSMSGRENATNGVQQLSKKEIEDLLRKGAYGALMDEEDEGSKFCEEDIDQILLRRTHTITIESEGKGSTFAKASFVASGNRTDISLDDPNFWQKWAKKAELDIDALNGRNNLVIDTPRVRKQTRLYSAVKEDELMEFSDLESDSEEKPCTKPRRLQDKSQGYARSECFRVEKNLLVYGWGRWTDILSHGRYKRQLTEQDVETICRTILVYCLNHYRGDENIKSFIWDLITPTADGQTRALVNHSGLSAPVPRGRKGKKVKAQSAQPVVQHADWLAGCNPDALFQEDSYKKHLKHHCNKVLLRVRMLYYLRQEVIGDQADKILEGADSSEADVWIPEPFHAEVPTDWWDKEADKSLLIGVFKHGYEKYNSMRADPALCFLERVGMPDAKAIAAEQRGTDMLADGGDGGEFDREDEDPEYKPTRTPFKDEIDEFANSPPEDKEESVEIHAAGKHSESNAELGQLYWPNTSTLTTRLRRLITAYQRSYKREQMRQEALMKTDRRRRRPREEVRALEAEREAIISEKRQKWTRREEADFYRVASTFGVIFDPVKQQFDWNQFRAFARLDKKSDESLEKYFSCFVAMCRRVCRMPSKADDAGAVSRGKNFDEESNASLSTARDETRDGFYMEDGDPSVAQLLHERTFAFSFWPKDRVMINRLDSICEAVLKGKWPVNRRQMFDFQGLLPGCTSTSVDSPLQKRSFAELSMVGHTSIGGSEDITSSPHLSKEDTLSLSVPRQRRRRRRKIEIEAERAAKRRNLMEMVAQLRESQVVSENGQEKVVDLSKASREATSSTSNFSSLTSKFILPNVSTPVSDAFKTQMELLQAGLSRTPTRHLLNGSLVDGEPPMKRRRGRRKNVEGLDLLFMSHKRTSLSAEDAEVTKGFEEDVETPPTRSIPSPGQLDPDTRIPVINLEDGTRLVGEDAPKNKDLVEWLKLHPTYTVDMPSYVPKNADVLFSSFQKPKQKRHRCRNPNKLDINTLTGEERVPVVNKRNGKKMGGAMAPPMKDLPRWLEENPEFAVAPDWTDIVKQSGFVPESMFDRLLTGPVVRGEGASRRGRRPKSEIARAAAAAAAVASTSGINPLLVNSLFAGMDLTSLQNLQSLQSLQLAGLMGFPPGLATAAAAGGDSKNPAAVLPLMLPGMAGLPGVFGLGGLLNAPLSAAAGNAAPGPGQGDPEDGTAKAEEKGSENDDENKDSEKSTDAVSATDSANGSVGAATATAGLPSNPLAFNPFLLSTMAPGLFYPSMFLPPGLGGLTLPGFPALAGLQNAVGAGEDKPADKAEGAPFKDEETLEGSDAEESLDKTAESSVLEDEIAQGEELDSLDGGDEMENNENDE